MTEGMMKTELLFKRFDASLWDAGTALRRKDPSLQPQA
jgi:hypothetical protein